MLKALQVDG